MAYLMVIEGENPGERIPLAKVVCFGRGVDMDVVLDDVTASKRHARVVGDEEGGFLVEDLGSSNGTFLNGAQVMSHPLADGDMIKVGATTMRFVGKKSQPSAARGSLAYDKTMLDISENASSTSVISAVDVGYETGIWDSDKDSSMEELTHTNYRLRTMLDISQALGTGLDEQELLKKILDNLFKVFPDSHRGFVILRDPETGNLSPAATRVVGMADASEERLQISATILEYVLQKKRAVLSSDAMSDERFPTSESIMELSMRSVMCAPLMADDEVLGFILMDTQRVSRTYDEEGLTLLAGIANQAALTIANARLHTKLVKRERLEQDLRNAREIQTSFLPKEPPIVEGYRFLDWYEAAQEVGGDFYDFVALPDSRMIVVVGDVSGKGITAALMMAKMTSNVRFLATTVPEPGLLLQRLNEVALESASDMFVTVLIMVLDYRNHSVAMANAGHCYPVVVRRGGAADILEVESSFPVGIAPGADFPVTTVDVGEGEVLCAFTDGIIEAMSEEREQLGYEGLTAALRNAPGGATEVVKNIQRAMRNHVGSAPQSDDLTLVCLERSDETQLELA